MCRGFVLCSTGTPASPRPTPAALHPTQGAGGGGVSPRIPPQPAPPPHGADGKHQSFVFERTRISHSSVLRGGLRCRGGHGDRASGASRPQHRLRPALSEPRSGDRWQHGELRSAALCSAAPRARPAGATCPHPRPIARHSLGGSQQDGASGTVFNEQRVPRPTGPAAPIAGVSAGLPGAPQRHSVPAVPTEGVCCLLGLCLRPHSSPWVLAPCRVDTRMGGCHPP